MEKEFIPYEQALALKELGFDEPCICIYNREKVLRFNNLNNPNDRNKGVKLTSNNGRYPAPTYQQAFRWFREKYKLFGQVNIHTYFIYDISNDELKMVKQYDKLVKTYEEAELECLKKLIEIINERKGT